MTVHQVSSLNKVNPTKYIEGDIFLTKQSIGMLHNGKIETFVKRSDVREMIQDEVKKVLNNDKK